MNETATESPHRVCTRCVMDTSAPDIEFDPEGVCNYCRDAYARLRSELFSGDEHRERLDALIAEIKRDGAGKPYDCIIGVSGGVDSSYTAYLVKKFGLRPLAVHFDNGWNSELAVENIERLLKKLDIDLHTHVVDWDEFKDLQLAFLKASVANSEIPTDHAITALMYGMAAKCRVKYIISGGNLATETVMPAAWMHDAKDLMFLKAIHRRHGTLPLRTFPTMSYTRLAWYTFVRRIRYVGILNYVDYRKEEAMRILEAELGWRRYQAKHFESIYTRFFQGYLLPEKFRMDKRRPHLSSLIVSGQMTREQALQELQGEPYDPKLAAEDIIYIRRKFGLSEEDFAAIMAAPVRESDRYPNSEALLRALAPLVRWARNVATARSER
jgi:N-acetyl sugar amidotransferase